MARQSKKKTTRSRSRKKKNTVSVDFEGVESGGGRPVPDGNYNAFINKVTEEEGQNSGEPYLHCVYKIGDGTKHAGATIHDNISLQPQSLWRFRTLLECMGYEVEDGPMDIDLEDILEETVGIEVTNEEYEGRDRPRITGFMPPLDEDELGADEEEEYEEEEGDEDEDEEEEYEEEEEDEEPAPKKKRRSRAKKPKKLRVGSKVSFADEEGDAVKGVIVEMDDDTANVEDSAGDVWEVDLSELEAA